MNFAYGIIVTYQANGKAVLQPDHGFSVRLIIPEYIGDRMMKWLKHINFIPYETRNHDYHYHDNRILPPQITAKESLSGNWWYKPGYIFNKLNINSAIAAPDHNESLSIAMNIDKELQVAGYSYTGGGRQISRVEVSIDNGVHWELATLERMEKPTDNGIC